MKTYILSFLCLLLLPLAAGAQRLTARAPQSVETGQQFKVVYSIDTDDASGFRMGEVPDGIEVLIGPMTSQSSSWSMTSSGVSSQSSITYTFVMMATRKGNYTIPAAHVSVGGKGVASQALHISASGNAVSVQGGGQGGGRGGQRGGRGASEPPSARIGGNDLFIKVSSNKQRVHEQEPILLTYKVYTQVDLTQLEGKMPDLKGFHTQEVQLPQQKSFKVERVAGKQYYTVTWSQYVMFPQITGKLEIPQLTFNGVVAVRNRNVDPFEAFFNGGSGYTEKKVSIKAPGLSIQVDPLPARPADFSGGVGQFSIAATMDKKSVKEGDPVKLHVVVSGVGNLKLIKTPTVEWPEDFDTYDAKQTDKTRLSTRGVEGSMVFDFLAVPRNKGKYDIPGVKLTYYDTSAGAYKTVSTEPMTLDVIKGDGTSSYKSPDIAQVRERAKDIRFIKLGDSPLRQSDDHFFGSMRYMGLIALLLIVFASLFIVFRKRAIYNSDISRVKGRKANKVATRRLRKAGKLMAAGNGGAFYDEVLRALWGYVGDKLSIAVEQISRDNITGRLTERGVDEATIGQFIGAIDECEFERYAPGDAAGNMKKTYDAAMTAIEKIEGTLKKKSAAAGRTAMLAALCLLSLSATAATKAATATAATAATAATKADADSAYVKGRYQQAIRLYGQMLEHGANAAIYYNQANAYYRSGDITRAILGYERALLLSPGDGDIRHNLEIARSKTADRITPEGEMFFVSWWHQLCNVQSVDGWAYTALVSLLLGIVLVLVYLFTSPVWLRKCGFFGSLVLLLLFAMANIMAWQQRSRIAHRDHAIIIAPAASVKSSPTQGGTNLFILHEGTKVEVSDATMRGWRQIRLADGKEGWIETAQMETI